MFVTYTSRDEILVTTRKKEVRALDLWFKNTGRKKKEYDREETTEPGVLVISVIKID